MRLLLDTSILLAIAENERSALPASINAAVDDLGNHLFASAASLWEIAIKHRLGRLPLPCRLGDWPEVLSVLGIGLWDVRTLHVLHELDPLPDTRDPFDRLLLAVCQVEDARLLTIDRKLLDHPAAWRPAAA